MYEAGYEWDTDNKELKKVADKEQIKKNLQDNSFRRMFEQKPAWSEEDEQVFNTIINSLDRRRVERVWHTTIEEIVNWFESLKDRYTWKPSELQMEALESATENCAYSEYQDCLRELIEQLKKLRKE